MINNYYTTISLDPLGPYCPSMLNPAEPSFAQQVSKNGKYVTINEPVKKLHKIKRGETLASVAKKYHCTSAQLKGWNKSKLARSSKIIAGQSLAVYVNQPRSIYIEKPLNGSETDDDKLLITDSEKKELDNSVADQEQKTLTIAKVAEKVTPPAYLYHTVAPGDTLFNIAKRYEGITVEELKSLNKIQDGKSLKPGTKLKLKVKA